MIFYFFQIPYFCLFQDLRLTTDLESRGTGTLESRTVTVCSGLDLVNITYNNFVAPDEKAAKVSEYRYHTVAIFGATILVLFHVSKSLQFIWRLGTRRWNLRVPILQMNCSDLT